MSSAPNPTAEKILDAALSLLEADPPVRTRMSDIAKAAGVSRQAVYLHFPSRAALLTAAARRLDVVKQTDRRLAPSRAAATGRARLEAFIAAWTGYIPAIAGVARALLAMEATDPDAAAAWADRMRAFHEGCAAATAALARDGDLAPGRDAQTAADLLFALLSFRTWEELTQRRGWSQAAYAAEMQRSAARLLLPPGRGSE